MKALKSGNVAEPTRKKLEDNRTISYENLATADDH